MKEKLEKLWNEYFFEECSVIETEEERSLLKNLSTMREAACRSLTKEQNEAVEKSIEALYKMQGAFIKKAFFKGCEFAVSIIIESGSYGKL